MIHEYAIDPACFRDWKDVRFIADHFGFPKGRLIGKLPSNWKRAVFDQTARLPALDRSRVETLLARLDKTVFASRAESWRPELPWLENALREHSRSAFQAIVVNDASLANDPIVNLDDLHAGHPLFAATTNASVLRNAKAMAEHIAPVLSMAKEVAFVDPHFDPAKARFRSPLGAFLKVVETSNRWFPDVKVSYITSDEIGSEEFERRCRKFLPLVIPNRLAMGFRQAAAKSMHNRYVLTDRGGAAFGVGLDERGSDSEVLHDEVSLLDAVVYKRCYAEVFEMKPQFVVQGEKAEREGVGRTDTAK